MELGPNQERWMVALESGDYQQGTGYLEANGEFCCLGVAANLFLWDLRLANYGNEYQYGDSVADAPKELVELLKLRSSIGKNKEGSFSLTSMNDDEVPFNKIAATIRANPEDWFTESA